MERMEWKDIQVRAFGGYEPRSVLRYLEQIVAEHEEEVAGMRQENGRLAREAERLSRELARTVGEARRERRRLLRQIEAMSGEMARMSALAQEGPEDARILEEARRKAHAFLEERIREAAEIRAEADRMLAAARAGEEQA